MPLILRLCISFLVFLFLLSFFFFLSFSSVFVFLFQTYVNLKQYDHSLYANVNDLKAV